MNKDQFRNVMRRASLAVDDGDSLSEVLWNIADHLDDWIVQCWRCRGLGQFVNGACKVCNGTGKSGLTP